MPRALHVGRMWRHHVSTPKRLSELVALLSLSITVFLYIHTKALHAQLKEVSRGRAEKSAGPADAMPTSIAFKLPGRNISTVTDLQLDAQALNNTRHAVKDMLFFNRVPKVGSQTTMELMKRLAIRNHFSYHKDRTQKVENIKLSYYEEKRLTTLIDIFIPPSVYVKHVCFSNFTRYNLPMPIYVNMVRDPVERVISWYYYVRAPWYFIERKQAFPELPLPSPQWLKKNFETCVLMRDRECQYIEGVQKDGIGDHRRQTMFFCGHDNDCTGFNTAKALQKAKRNVEESYAVVGVLEQLNKTLTVLEHYVPRFFQGAMDVYYNDMRHFSMINKNTYKPPVSEHVKAIVRRNFTRELEFYDFCQQRLHLQYLALRLH